MFQRVRLRLSALLVLLFLALYALTSFLIYSLSVQLMIGSVDSVMEDTAQPLVEEVSSSFNQGQFPAEFVKLTKLSALYPKVSIIVLRDALGAVIASTNPKIKNNFPYQFSESKNYQTIYNPPAQSYYRVLTERISNPYQQTEGYLQIALNINHDLTSLHRLTQVLWIVAMAGTILAAIAGLYMSKLSLQPVIRSWLQQQQFVADASHELRTPLSIIQLNLEVINSDLDKTVGENSEWISVIHKETVRLRRLTQDLLTIARIGSPSDSLYIQPINLLDILISVVNSFQLTAESKGIALCVHHLLPVDESDQEFDTQGDQDRLYQLFTILIDNAIKYTVQGEVNVNLEKKRNYFYLSIKDTGIGIAPSQIGRVFDRFYRADAARVRETGGSGLGLAIAKLIVESHSGKITVQSAEGIGTEFTVQLPTL